jgi:hypothetical protein
MKETEEVKGRKEERKEGRRKWKEDEREDERGGRKEGVGTMEGQGDGSFVSSGCLAA